MSFQIEVTVLECGDYILTPGEAKGVNLPESNVTFENLPQSIVRVLNVLDAAGAGHSVEGIGVKQDLIRNLLQQARPVSH
jgi:hypothetical protein